MLGSVALVAFLWGKRQRKRKTAAAQQAHPQGPQYPASPHLQPSPYFPSPGDKPGWQAGYQMGQPMVQQQNPYFHQAQMAPYQDVQPMYGGMPSPPLSNMPPKHRLPSPPPVPMELSADMSFQEMAHAPVRSPPTPSPAYAEAIGQRTH